MIRATALVLLSCAACEGEPVAVVGKTRLAREDVSAFVAVRDRGAADAAALERLVERTLLAEAASRDGLADDPAVRAEAEAAAREVLARTYLERALGDATGEAVLRARYEATKDALTRRRIHVRHILVPLPREATPEVVRRAQSRASTLFARLQDGEAFAALAREASGDSVSAAQGGDLGPVLEGEVDPGFFEAAAALARGETSEPVRSPYGVHLLRAEADPTEVTPSFEEIRGTLAAEVRAEAQTQLLERLRAEIPVKTWPERLEGPR